jgi:hypothetical protein
MHSRIYYVYIDEPKDIIDEAYLSEDLMYELIHSYCHCDYVSLQPDSELKSDIIWLQDALFDNNTNIKIQKNQIGYYFDIDIKTFTNFKFLYIESIKNQISDLLQNIHSDTNHTLYSMSDIVKPKYDIYFVDQHTDTDFFLHMLLSLEFNNPKQIYRFYIIKTYDYHF